MIKIPRFNVDVDIDVDIDVDWCEIWDKIDESMISDILDKISEDFASKFRDWLKNNEEEILKKDLETITDRIKIQNVDPIDYKTLEGFAND